MICVYDFPGNDAFANALATLPHARRASLELHRFPDGETLVKVEPPPAGALAVVACSLDHPDAKALPLIFAAATLRELGAARVGLVAPYLAYMRQDKRFEAGEAVSSRPFAALLSEHFDWLVTVDPHLHRYRSLADIYRIETRVVHAAPRMAQWIRRHVERPLVIGPDEESRQWATDIAARADAPCVVLHKDRLGDEDVRVSLPDIGAWRDRTPVLVDDIVSSGRTMVAALRRLREANAHPPVCIGVHGILAGHAFDLLHAAGAAGLVTTDSVPNPTGLIELGPDLADAVERLERDACRSHA